MGRETEDRHHPRGLSSRVPGARGPGGGARGPGGGTRGPRGDARRGGVGAAPPPPSTSASITNKKTAVFPPDPRCSLQGPPVRLGDEMPRGLPRL